MLGTKTIRESKRGGHWMRRSISKPLNAPLRWFLGLQGGLRAFFKQNHEKLHFWRWAEGLQSASKNYLDHLGWHCKFSRTSLGPMLSTRANGMVLARVDNFLLIQTHLGGHFWGLIPILKVKQTKVSVLQRWSLSSEGRKKFLKQLLITF